MKNLVVALLLILAAGVGALYVTSRSEHGESATNTPDNSPLAEDYDYYVQNMRATRFDSKGEPVSQLQATRVTHFPEGDRAELEAPAFKSFGVDSDPWQVSARAGTLTPDSQRPEDRLELAGDVALRKPLPGSDFIEVRTSALTVFTTTEEALTDTPVSIQTRDNRLDGIGLQARLAENYLHMTNGTGTHDPATRP